MGEEFFPVFINLNGKRCLVVGGGNIAFRKIKTLRKYGARIDVVTEQLEVEAISGLAENIRIKKFEKEDIYGYFFVVAATDREDVNEKIFEEAESKNILVNNISSSTKCSARFAAILDREEFVVAVSSKGKKPRLAVEVRDKIGDFL
jgi:precorrin-2 dehydrogenase/sirohydrochlorin ferrochelatase